MHKVLAAAGVVFIFFGAITSMPLHEAKAATATWLTIPAAQIAALIQPVGTETDGSMSVPVTQNTVGWYAGGTAPGQVGSAVLDAHVYLAFKNLKKIQPGASIYVTKDDGTQLRFIVSTAKTYPYKQVPLQKLFTSNDARHLNLITCAGKWLPRQNTYDHRLVVYATLIE